MDRVSHATWFGALVMGRLVAGTVTIGLVLFSPVQRLATAQPAASQKPGVAIALATKPNPLRTGQNTLEVTVKGRDGKPVTDAEVTALFYMAAMPAMKMPEMRNTVALKHQKEGRYAGDGHVAMAGRWDVTVTVKRAGKEVGSKQFPVTAK